MGTLKTQRTEVILHPQRLRLIRALARGVLTTKQLGMLVPDIAQATLYRHLATLLDAGVIEVVAEQPVRGVVERSYSLVQGAAVLSGDDLTGASRDDHFRYFSIFATGLLAQFDRYLTRDSIDLEADGVGYQEGVLNLTDDEFVTFIASLSSLVLPLTKNEPGGGRTPRLLSTVVFPLDITPEQLP